MAAVTGVTYSNRRKLLWSIYHEPDLLLPSTGFQLYGRRRVFRCTAINDGLLYTTATVNHWPVAARSHGRVCRACMQSVPFSRCNWCLKHKPTWIISRTVNYCFRKLIINNLLFFESIRFEHLENLFAFLSCEYLNMTITTIYSIIYSRPRIFVETPHISKIKQEWHSLEFISWWKLYQI